MTPAERSIDDGGPVLEARIPVIGDCERQAASLRLEIPRSANERRDARGQGEGVDSRVFLPSVLVARRTVADDERERAADHVSHLDAIQLATLVELGGEQHRECGLIELHTGPVGLAAEPLVLIPMTIGELRGAKVAQRIESLACRAHRQQRAGALAQIAWPDEVIALPLLLGVTPGDAQARDHRSRIGLVEMRAQRHRRQLELTQALGRQSVGRRRARGALLVPAAPVVDLTLPRGLERLEERAQRQRGGRFRAAAEAERQHHFARQLPRQSDIARPGVGMLPRHRVVAREVLPAVARPDKPTARASPGILLIRRHRGERQRIRPLLRPQHAMPAMADDRRAVVVARAAEMRREERIGAQRLIARELDLHEQHVALARRRHAQRELEALVPVHDAHGGHSRRRKLQGVAVHPLDLHPEPAPVRDDEAEIPDLRNVDTRMVDLVEDAAADREPESRRTERAADHFLGAAGPGGRQARRAWSVGTAHRRDRGRDAARWLPATSGPSAWSPRHKLRPPLKALRLSPRRESSGSSFSRKAFPPPNTT